MQEKNMSQRSSDADHVRRLTQIGVALSAEKNIDRLLEKILSEARAITAADGGTLYLMSENEQELQFAFIQNESMGVTMRGAGEKISWPSVPVTGADGLPNHANVSAHVAITREAVNIEDVYGASGFNFDGPRAFDQKTGYRTKSMLVVPMLNHENEIIGVLQMIIALADIFEALTARDRPYKKGKTLGEALKIMDMMVKDHHIDANLYDLFVREKIYMDYAASELAPQQIDL